MSLTIFLELAVNTENEQNFITQIKDKFTQDEIIHLFQESLETYNAQHNIKQSLFLANCYEKYVITIFSKHSTQYQDASYELCRAWNASKDSNLLIKAETTLKKIINQKAGNNDINEYAELGFLYFTNHQFFKAKTYLVYSINKLNYDNLSTIERFEKYAPVLNNLIITLIALKEYKVAEKKLAELEKIVLEAGEQAKSRLAFVYFQFGALYNNMIATFELDKAINLFEKATYNFNKVLEYTDDNLMLEGTVYKGLADLHFSFKQYQKSDYNYVKAISLIKKTPFTLDNNNFYLLNFYKFWLYQLVSQNNFERVLEQINIIENNINASDNKEILNGDFTNKNVPLLLANVFHFKIVSKLNLNENIEEDINFTIILCEHLFSNNPINELSDVFNIYRNILLIKWSILTEQRANETEKTYSLLIWCKSLYTRLLTNLKDSFKEELIQERYKIGQLQNQLLDAINRNEDKAVFDIEAKIATTKLAIVNITKKTANYALVNYESIIKKVQAKLDNDTLFLDFYSSDNFLFLVMISKKYFQTLKINLPKKRLNEFIDNFIEAICNYSIDEYEFYEIQANLSNKILNPISKQINLKTYSKLSIVVDEKTGQLPLGLLVFENQNLDLQFEINYFFSTYAFIEQEENISTKCKSIGFIKPEYTGSASLKEANMEIKNIEKLSSEYYLKSELFQNNIKDELIKSIVSKDALHISSHLESNYYTGKLEPAIPLKSKAKTSNDYLFLNDIFYNNFETLQMVFLNCCNAISGKNIVGDGLQSFSTIFIKSGAKNVVHTVVKVNDMYARIFAETFYSYYLKNNNPTKALFETKKHLSINGYKPNMFGVYQIMVA